MCMYKIGAFIKSFSCVNAVSIEYEFSNEWGNELGSTLTSHVACACVLAIVSFQHKCVLACMIN